jgi:hypothetical protein
MRIINANVISDGLTHPDMCVVIDDKIIKDLIPMNQITKQSDQTTLDIKGNMLCAGFIDIHTHGCAMFDTMDASSVKVAVYGDQGMVRFDSEKPFEIEACSGKLDFTTGSAHTFEVPKSFYAEQMDCFARNVGGDTDRYLPVLRDGVRCQKILDAMINSDENGKWVEV